MFENLLVVYSVNTVVNDNFSAEAVRPVVSRKCNKNGLIDIYNTIRPFYLQLMVTTYLGYYSLAASRQSLSLL